MSKNENERNNENIKTKPESIINLNVRSNIKYAIKGTVNTEY